MRTIREEEIDLSEYRDFADAYSQPGRFLDDVYILYAANNGTSSNVWNLCVISVSISPL